MRKGGAGERLGQRQSKHDEQWNARFKELLEYKAEHGDCDVPASQGKLGNWVRVQRKTYMANSLTQDRIDRLNSIDFSWSLKEAEVPWETRFKELVQYKTEHGGCDVQTSQGKLGSWVSIQRKAYRAGSLAQGRIDRLNSIDFNWALKGPTVPWETRFKELVQYKAKHGDCNVPDVQGKLGNWVRSQRKAYKAGSFAQDRIDRLSGIGFKWALVERGSEVPWETRFKELVRYRAKHGDCIIPQRQGQLGKWTQKQRTNYKENKLAKDRIDRLSSMGFKWAVVEKGPKVPWETQFKELLSYRSEHGDCNVPRRHGKLGSWVSSQRRAYMADSLAQVRIDRLNSIGFEWALKKAVSTVPWETRLNELIKYKSKHGDCDVPVRQGKLGMWVSNQRQYYMADLLSQDRIDRLSGIGFKWSLKVKCPEVPWETRLTSSSSTRQSTATAMFRGNRDSLGSGFLRKDKAIERARYRRTASLA